MGAFLSLTVNWHYAERESLFERRFVIALRPSAQIPRLREEKTRDF